MFWSILGDYGAGKTCWMVLEATRTKRNILTNFKLDLPNAFCIDDPTKLRDLGFDKLVLLDEMQDWYDNRMSMSRANKYLSSIFNQSRHRGIDVMGTHHLFTDIDLRFRNKVHRIVKAKRIPNGRKRDFWDFDYQVLNTYTGRIRKFRIKYGIMEKLFPLFDTHEIINPLDMEDMEAGLLKKHNKPEYLKIAQNMANKIWNDGIDKITHPNVELAMIEHDFNLDYEKTVYAKLMKMREKEL